MVRRSGIFDGVVAEWPDAMMASDGRSSPAGTLNY